MTASIIVAICIVSILGLFALLMGVHCAGYEKGYNEGFNDHKRLTESQVIYLLKRAGEMEEMNDDRVDAAPESGSEEN